MDREKTISGSGLRLCPTLPSGQKQRSGCPAWGSTRLRACGVKAALEEEAKSL